MYVATSFKGLYFLITLVVCGAIHTFFRYREQKKVSTRRDLENLLVSFF